MIIRRIFFIALSVLGGILLAPHLRKQNNGSTTENHKVIGVKIYEHPGPYDQLAETWKSLGINTVYTGADLLSKDTFREAMIAAGLQMFLIAPTFYNPQYLERHPEDYAITVKGEKAIDDWVHFVCPSCEAFKVQHLDSLTALLKRLQPCGLSIDFIRHFVFWETMDPAATADDIPETCFCDRCIERFEEWTDMTVEGCTVPEKAAFIHSHCQVAWGRWKQTIITDWVRAIVSTAHHIDIEMPVNIHLLPWRQTDFDDHSPALSGQNITELSQLVSTVSPMTYAPMTQHDAPWIERVVQDIAAQSSRPVLPSIQVGKAYAEAPIDAGRFEADLRTALKTPSSGVIFWNWDHLAVSPEKQAVVRRLCGSRP